jgi:hypothetical protein
MSDDNTDKKMAALSKLREMRSAGGAKPERPGDGAAAEGGAGGKGEALRKFLANRKGGTGGGMGGGGLGGGAGKGGGLREMLMARKGGGMGAAGGGLRERLAGGGGGAGGEGGGKRELVKKLMEARKGKAAGAGADADTVGAKAVSATTPADQRAMLRERIAKLQAKLDQLDIDGMDEDLE